MPSVLQDWVQELPSMQQSVLLSCIRGPDGLHKEHIAKYVLRWLRRCVLLSAFDKCVLETPTDPRGGSFTGPLKHPDPDKHEQLIFSHGDTKLAWDGILWGVAREYIRSIDEVPHHFVNHLMHAAQIIGYKHPDPWKREFWRGFYHALVADAHLFAESEELMDKRLGDTEKGWRAREAVPAKDVPKVRSHG